MLDTHIHHMSTPHVDEVSRVALSRGDPGELHSTIQPFEVDGHNNEPDVK